MHIHLNFDCQTCPEIGSNSSGLIPSRFCPSSLLLFPLDLPVLFYSLYRVGSSCVPRIRPLIVRNKNKKQKINQVGFAGGIFHSSHAREKIEKRSMTRNCTKGYFVWASHPVYHMPPRQNKNSRWFERDDGGKPGRGM